MAVTISKKVKTIFKFVRQPKILTTLLAQINTGYLFDVGWFNSFELLQSVDKDCNPIPWFTYPFNDFLTPRLNKTITVFEFGSGSSTLFFAERVKKVFSVEHNNEWYQKLKQKKMTNVELVLTESDSSNDYLNYFNDLKEKIDIIVIDGINRVECLLNAKEKLSENGIIILDDSERSEYLEGINYLLNNKFKELSFWGIAPSVLFKKCTTVFYKDKNCLGI